MTPQSIASVARQVLALAGIVMGALTQSVTALHLPVAFSTIIAAGGAVLLAVEHYVADPSTGNATALNTAVTTAVPVLGHAEADAEEFIAKIRAALNTPTVPPTTVNTQVPVIVPPAG
jgi:hypothetical protein